jgi:hypothetical protein
VRITGIWWVVAAAASLVAGHPATGMPMDFNFSISYSGSSITGQLVGLDLDASGNGTNVDPSSVLLFSVPGSVGLTASPGQPYVFVPATYERSTTASPLISTTPGVYGFQVSHYTIDPSAQDLLMVDAGKQVTLVFNFGAASGAATYGIQAGADALWPAPPNSFVSFSAVPEPATGMLTSVGLLCLSVPAWLARRRRSRSHGSAPLGSSRLPTRTPLERARAAEPR